ncbi:MAG: type II secretion system F family protein [Planctomycetota bacterium JB042]
MPAKIERKKPKTATVKSTGGGAPTAATEKKPLFGGGVSAKKLTQFTTQLSILQSAGITIVRSLGICEGQLRPGPLKNVVGAVKDDVEGGASLSEALGKYPHVFDRLYVNMVRAGETGGILDQILNRLADFAEKTEKIKSKIKEALAYPVVVLLFALGVLTFVMLVIVPRFEDIFKQFGQELPAITQLLIDFSRFMATRWYVVFGAPILLFFLYRDLLRVPKFRFAVDKLKLRTPIAGTLIEKTIIARFSRTLGTLLNSGVPILEALEIVQASIPNTVLAAAVADVRASVREGETMAGPLLESRIFDDLVVNMIDVGEATGSLDQMLLKIADTYEDEVDTQVGTLFKLMEPILLLLLAGIVGFIVVALFLPILKVMDNFSK